MYHIFLIHSPVNGHQSCFNVLAIVVLLCTLEYMCIFQLQFSQGICPVMGLMGHLLLFSCSAVYAQ